VRLFQYTIKGTAFYLLFLFPCFLAACRFVASLFGCSDGDRYKKDGPPVDMYQIDIHTLRITVNLCHYSIHSSITSTYLFPFPAVVVTHTTLEPSSLISERYSNSICAFSAIRSQYVILQLLSNRAGYKQCCLRSKELFAIAACPSDSALDSGLVL
jgi:hypothetical protein